MAGSGLVKFDGEIWTELIGNMAPDWIYDLAIDTQGNIWFSSGVGLGKFDGENLKWYNNPGFYFNVLAIDGQDNIWNGTHEGLTFYREGDVTLSPTPSAILPSGPVAVEEKFTAMLPSVFSLSQNYPNPFNPSTTIRFDLPEASDIVLTVYNVSGQEVARLADESLGAGSYIVEWDGRDMSGQLVSSGVYLYRLKGGEYTATRRMIMMK
jgi:hypothetical protein